MIYTITLNPAIDRSIFVDEILEKDVTRISKSVIDAAGKGINVAKVTHAIGEDVICLGFVGGSNGKLLVSKLDQLGIAHNFITITGNTRENIKIYETSSEKVIELNEAGPWISKENVEALLVLLSRVVQAKDFVVLSGSIPQGIPQNFYQDILAICHEKGVKTLLDTSGESFRFALKSSPSVIKPNKVELENYVGMKLHSIPDYYRAGMRLLDQGVEEVIISLGKEGSIYISKDKAYKIEVPKVIVKSSVGAGDAFVGGYVCKTIQNAPIEDCLRFASSIATASVLNEGSGVGSMENVLDIEKTITITPLSF